MRLVVGLGNPGPEYEWTRHNVGFHVVEAVARRAKVIFEPGRKLGGWNGRSDFVVARISDPECVLVEPHCYMNLSGDVVAPLARHLALTPDRILVVYDDFDLPLGAKRLRARGGPGTHNGMRSLVNRLAAEFPDRPMGEFPRLRIGIGAAGTDAARHVLERFTPKERTEVEIAVEEAADAILDWHRTGDIDACMSRYHSRWNQGV